MKRLIFLLAFISVLLWPINYLKQNHKLESLVPHSVFASDYQGRQLILRNINLYPNIFLARLFQNKALVVTNKYFDNFFDFIDPNYYFFGSHPREVVNGQNYTRLPLFAIFPILWFLLWSRGHHKKIILSVLTFSILIFSFFTNHHVYDFVLWPIFLYMIYIGTLDILKKYRRVGTSFCLLLLVEILYELFRTLS